MEGASFKMIEPNTEDELLDEAEWDSTLLRVRYAETDKMGVVYHANYLVWFEIGRTEYCRERGFAYREMEENDDSFLVVVESYCRYKAPAHYDDELMIRTRITELRRRSLRFGYEVVRVSDGKIIAEGETGHVVTTKDGRVRSFPPHYGKLLSPTAPDLHSTQSPDRVPEDIAPE